tara:strand:+ start:430 stop:636 length:207 start_codon:yes stop_codon:yes gene_type:complete
MIELVVLIILFLIGFIWFMNLSDNSNKEEDPEIEILREKKTSKIGVYLSIFIVSGFFVWLLITNGNLN